VILWISEFVSVRQIVFIDFRGRFHKEAETTYEWQDVQMQPNIKLQDLLEKKQIQDPQTK